jgi:hypothetical protein
VRGVKPRSRATAEGEWNTAALGDTQQAECELALFSFQPFRSDLSPPHATMYVLRYTDAESLMPAALISDFVIVIPSAVRFRPTPDAAVEQAEVVVLPAVPFCSGANRWRGAKRWRDWKVSF